ncbi:carbohydrate ABC transporter permease [Paenibacillus qinlingensis]|uniref:carbohydrate ABC transporter permease n=1 Tax=Paenibacillus qinlingensis TaxID=1837343 RepID=UPI00156548C2|nr:carbohydrate ABC transporter permease [Paenibacillus qinlingensis]NQX60029.1 carbohydrate ABC transporter permease [Paenibacillus qinlingensis]
MVRGKGDKIFDGFVFMFLLAVGIVALFPLLYVLSVSLTPFSELLKNGGFVIIPKSITFLAYKELFSMPRIPDAFRVTLFITVVGTIVNMILTVLLAYPLSRKKLPGRSFFLLMIVFTMLFSGGIIPSYLTVKYLGLLNSVWAMIIPGAIWSFNVLIVKSFVESLPEELIESAHIDGAKELKILMKIIVPLSMPVIMTVSLFYMVGHWNEFFQAILYVTPIKLQPLQIVVRSILLQSNQAFENPEVTLPSATLQMAVVIFASAPIIMVYPFIQKYFTKGMMLGAIKG